MTREEWDRMLNEPLPGRANKPTPAQLEQESEDFMALLKMQGG